MVTLRQMQETHRPVVIPDTSDYPDWAVMPELDWLRSYVGAPILARGQLVGVLNVDSATPGFFRQEHAEQLAAFAAQAAIAIENTQLVEETSRRADQLATLNRIGLAISSALDLDEVLERPVRAYPGHHGYRRLFCCPLRGDNRHGRSSTLDPRGRAG